MLILAMVTLLTLGTLGDARQIGFVLFVSEIFNACHISATHLSGQKACFDYQEEHIFIYSNCQSFWS